MPTTSGGFGEANGPLQCTAISKRSQLRCKGPAILGSPNQKCRMHGGKGTIGTANASFKTGRYSRYIPANIEDLYEQALSNPDLLDMSDHIALLEAKVAQTLADLAEEEVVPRWSDMKELFADFETKLLAGDQELMLTSLAALHDLIEGGVTWDRSWGDIKNTMEQLRKMTDTEVKRKKELNQMVPIERVMALMAAVATAVKRNVTNPAEIQVVYREIEVMRTGSSTIADSGISRVGPEVIEVSPNVIGPSGGRSKHAKNRTKKRLAAKVG